MEDKRIERLEHRVGELENLAWSLFRVLEGYVTFNETPIAKQRGVLTELADVLPPEMFDTGCVGEEAKRGT